MFKLSRKSDYALMSIKHLAPHGGERSCSAAEMAELYEISTPLMAKVLQKLAKQGLLAARHGSAGGYQLARDPDRITALDVISAIDGPLPITSCVTNPAQCGQTPHSPLPQPLPPITYR